MSGRKVSHGVFKPPGTNWRLLVLAALVYGAMYLATNYFFAETPSPLPADASPRQFAEGRVMQHLHQLATVIGHRQVGSVGEEQAAQYIFAQLQQLAAEAATTRPDLRVEAARESVSGGVTMHAFKFEIANVYRNLTNIVLRISPADPVRAGKKGVLVNSHYDSTLGTVGASDAASCICIQLELARTIIADPAIQLAAPVVFLFNGGEETLSQAANGFFAQSRHAKDLGAFINLESTGPWGPDVVFQHTGDWTLAAYARSAPHPRGTTMAQDFFDLGLIPADTDYRMFSYKHYGALPGIDVAFIFDGTAYHTARDEVARIRPGTLQGMGVNVLAALQEFARVLAGEPPAPRRGAAGGSVYFDLWGRAMVIYSHAQAKALHHAPLAIVLLLPLLGTSAGGGQPLGFASLLNNALLALASLLCAVALPAAVGAARALLSGIPMAWYGRRHLAYCIYLPAAAAGLMLPYMAAPAQQAASSAPRRSLGAALLFALICTGLTSIGFHSSFFYAFWAASAALAAPLLGAFAAENAAGTSSQGTPRGWGSATALLLIFLLPIFVVLPSSMTFMAHVMEKVGLAGGATGPVGLAAADTAMGAVAGATILLTFGTLAPYLIEALGRRRGRQLAAALLAASLATAGVASALYRQPYSRQHPKRLLLQHIHEHGPDGAVKASKLSVVGLDSFPLAPALPPSFLQQPAAPFSTADWESFYPLNYLVGIGEARRAPGPEDPSATPTLRLLRRAPLVHQQPTQAQQQERQQGQARLDRLELELDTGKPGAWGVMNFTVGGLEAAGEFGGDQQVARVVGWSLSDKVAETEVPGGGVSHMVRFAGNLYARRYRFHLDLPAGASLAVRLYVKHIEDSTAAKELVGQLPDWTSTAAVVAYHSRWSF